MTSPSFVLTQFYCDALELPLSQHVPAVSPRRADIKIKQLEQNNKLPTLVPLSCTMLAGGLSSYCCGEFKAVRFHQCILLTGEEIC